MDHKDVGTEVLMLLVIFVLIDRSFGSVLARLINLSPLRY